MGGSALSDSPQGQAEQPPGPPYLLDTHVWLWYMAGSDRLPTTLRTEIDKAVGELSISPISVWELGMLHARGRIDLKGGTRLWIAMARQRFPIEEASLTSEVAVRSHEVELDHRDPADRLLAATALVHGLTLLTMDSRLVAAAWLPTWSG